MGKQRGKIGKYCKISLQKKFQLLKLTELGKKSLKESSEHLQINYSTAKTIFFQFQNRKNRQKLTFFQNDIEGHQQNGNIKMVQKMATYKENSFPQRKCNQVKLVCTQNRNQSNGFDQMSIETSTREKQLVLLNKFDEKCKTVNQNAQTLDQESKNLHDSQREEINQNQQKITNTLYGNQLYSFPQWTDFFTEYSIMNLGQFTYCLQMSTHPTQLNTFKQPLLTYPLQTGSY